MGTLTKLRVLNYLFSINKRNKFIAHCLNFDLVASADTLEEAEKRLDVIVRLHIESYLKTNGASGLGNDAPKEIWTKYTELLRQGHVLPSSTLTISVPEVVPMQNPLGELQVVAAQAA